MSRIILIVVSALMTYSSYRRLRVKAAVHPGISFANMIIWATILVDCFVPLPMQTALVVFVSIILSGYSISEQIDKIGIANGIMAFILNAIHVMVVGYGIINRQYTFVLVATIVIYVVTILLTLLIEGVKKTYAIFH